MQVQPEDAAADSASSALLAAADAGNTARVTELLSAGASHTTTDSVGRAALYVAARAGHADVVTALTVTVREGEIVLR